MRKELGQLKASASGSSASEPPPWERRGTDVVNGRQSPAAGPATDSAVGNTSVPAAQGEGQPPAEPGHEDEKAKLRSEVAILQQIGGLKAAQVLAAKQAELDNLCDDEEPVAESDSRIAILRKELVELAKVRGPLGSELYAIKQRDLDGLLAQKRAGKPLHVRIKDLQGKVDRKHKAVARHKEEVNRLESEVKAAQEKLLKAQAQTFILQDGVSQAQRELDAVLSSAKVITVSETDEEAAPAGPNLQTAASAERASTGPEGSHGPADPCGRSPAMPPPEMLQHAKECIESAPAEFMQWAGPLRELLAGWGPSSSSSARQAAETPVPEAPGTGTETEPGVMALHSGRRAHDGSGEAPEATRRRLSAEGASPGIAAA